LSSAEAELNALTTGLTEAIFARNFVSELTGFKPAISAHTDSSAAKAIATRTGVTPRTKHLSIKALFAQAFFESGGGKLLKVPGTKNPADLFTKPLGPQELTKHFGALGFVVYGPRMDRTSDDEDEIKMIPGSRANLMEARRRALEVSGIGRAARAAGGGGAANLVAMVLALSAAGVRGASGPLAGATGPLWPGPTFGSGTAVCAVGDNGGDGTNYLHLFVVVVLMLVGMAFLIGAAFGYFLGRRAVPVPPALPVPSAPTVPPALVVAGRISDVRTVSVQAPVTYTAVRGATKPRFLPLPESAAGVGL
jgi:hypothetical protein